MTVLYLDVHGLYAGLEKRRRPSLRGVPLVLTGEEVVVDLCGAAHERGVKRGMPGGHVRNLLPEAEVMELDPSSYGPDLELVARLGASISPQVEVFSPERIFVQLTSRDDPREAVLSALRRFPRDCGHRFLAGFAGNKLLARMAVLVMEDGRMEGELLSRERQVHLLEVSAGDERSFLRDLPISFLWLFPDHVMARLDRLGIDTIGELAEVPESLLSDHFGPMEGVVLRRNARGEDFSPVASDYPPPRVVWQRSTDGPLSLDITEILGEASRHLAAGLRDRASVGHQLSLGGLRDDGQWVLHRRHFSNPTGRGSSLRAALVSLWEKITPSSGGGETFLRIRAEVSGLVRQSLRQGSIFSRDQGERGREELRELVGSLNDKYPGGTVFWGEEIPVSYREQRLSFWDPIRRKGGGRGSPGRTENQGSLF